MGDRGALAAKPRAEGAETKDGLGGLGGSVGGCLASSSANERLESVLGRRLQHPPATGLDVITSARHILETF